MGNHPQSWPPTLSKRFVGTNSSRCVLALFLFLAGCAAGSTIQETQPAQGLGKYKSVFIEVTTDDPENIEAVGQLKSSLTGRLAVRTCFENCVTGPDPGNADLRLSASVTGIRGVSNVGRVLFGAMAGRAVVRADIRLTDVKSGEVVAVFSIEGKSSGGWVGAGTTSQALDKTAEGVAQYIYEHK
jgi:hypothetical protein